MNWNKKYIYIAVIIIGGLIFNGGFLKSHVTGSAMRYGMFTYVCMALGIIFIITGILAYIIECFRYHENNRIMSRKVNLHELVVAIILISSVTATAGIFGSSAYISAPLVGVNAKWSIGIFASSSNEPFNFMGERGNNPTLTKDDVTDVRAKFVADPFLIEQDNLYFMFFEVYNEDSKKGEIALATSKDGFKWRYERIVLAEPFHLSYPCVFRWNDEYYMIPEASKSKSVRLYKATSFPYTWIFVKTLLEGREFKDNTIFRYKEHWWLFSETESDDVLRLYYADTPLGPWTEHPKSPVVKGNKHYARPGGNVTVFDGRIVRYAQDCKPFYGNKVWAFEITNLTTKNYQEKLVERPSIDRQTTWNSDGMHQISPLRNRSGKWIAAVDGHEARYE